MIKVEDGILCCPCCGFKYIHHTRTNIYERNKEDDERGLHLDVIGSSAQVSTEMYNNPSCRRDGIIISFSCENCFKGSELRIYQHKGNTFITFE